MPARIFLALVGLLYLALAVWCAGSPAETSAKVGFTLEGDSGSSEFFTVYGGLEFGLALVFLLPLVCSEFTDFSLLSCLLIHGSLVAFRGISLLLFPDYGPMTAQLAVGEWVILLAGLGILLIGRRNAQACEH